MTWPKKIYLPTYLPTYLPISIREHPKRGILETCVTFETFDQNDEEAWPDQKDLPTYLPTDLPPDVN